MNPVLRVALLSTLLVGVAYLIVAGIIYVVVGLSLTSSIDARLQRSLSLGLGGLEEYGAGSLPYQAAPGSGKFTAPLLIWFIGPNGSELSNTNVLLPISDIPAGTYSTSAIAGETIRLAAARGSFGTLVVGQDMGPATSSENALGAIELGIWPVLLLAVFFGSIAIGTRVASPYERARAQQMEFSANASHELRTPLSVIEAQASLGLSQKRSVIWYQQALQRITAEAKRMHALVDELLWLARLESSSRNSNREHIDIGILLTNAVDRFQTLAQSKQITMTATIPEGSNAILAPADWIDKLIGILLDNACRYCNENGAIEAAVERKGSHITLRVGDSGPGIPGERRAVIFRRFERAVDEPGGSGLGLAIADAIVQGTGGVWKVGESALGGALMEITWNSSLRPG